MLGRKSIVRGRTTPMQQQQQQQPPQDVPEARAALGDTGGGTDCGRPQSVAGFASTTTTMLKAALGANAPQVASARSLASARAESDPEIDAATLTTDPLIIDEATLAASAAAAERTSQSPLPQAQLSPGKLRENLRTNGWSEAHAPTTAAEADGRLPAPPFHTLSPVPHQQLQQPQKPEHTKLHQTLALRSKFAEWQAVQTGQKVGISTVPLQVEASSPVRPSRGPKPLGFHWAPNDGAVGGVSGPSRLTAAGGVLARAGALQQAAAAQEAAVNWSDIAAVGGRLPEEVGGQVRVLVSSAPWGATRTSASSSPGSIPTVARPPQPVEQSGTVRLIPAVSWSRSQGAEAIPTKTVVSSPFPKREPMWHSPP